MKKIALVLFLAALILLSSMHVCAEPLTIDPDSATYEELTEAYELLKVARMARLKEIFISTHEVEPADGISFRGVPWGSTRKETEDMLGVPSSVSSNITVRQGTVNTDGIGMQTRYKDWTLAGYPLQYAELNYVYPVVDGDMIRDDDLAVFYLAEYDIWDVGDTTAVIEDLSAKLSKLYGTHVTGDRGALIWTDQSQNTISLTTSSNRVYLIYASGQAEGLLSYGRQAIQDERAEQEELLRIQNQDNVDGL